MKASNIYQIKTIMIFVSLLIISSLTFADDDYQ